MPDTPAALPVREEYVIQRRLANGRWITDSPDPAPTAEKALADASWFMRSTADYRTVRRTITSEVVAQHLPPPGAPDA